MRVLNEYGFVPVAARTRTRGAYATGDKEGYPQLRRNAPAHFSDMGYDPFFAWSGG